MSVKEITSKLIVLLALNEVISTNTTTDGAIIDTADYDLGLMFTVYVPLYTDGTYVLSLTESDDSGMSGATVLAGDQIVGTLPSVAAASADGAALLKVGVISNKRYVRASIVSTGTSTGASVSVLATEAAELAPT